MDRPAALGEWVRRWRKADAQATRTATVARAQSLDGRGSRGDQAGL